MRGVLLALLVALPAPCIVLPGACLAQEPLLLRIRPNDAPPREAGAGGAPSDAEVAAQARAAREAVWERADRRARQAIASVCTGCLKAAPPVSSPPAPPSAPSRIEPPPVEGAAAETAGAAPLSLADSR